MFTNLLDELNSAEYPNLRPMQRDVLQSYAALLTDNGNQLSQSDVAIEMPAGTGKTLVALLVAEKHRRLGRPVAILTGTKQLGHQVYEDAVDLGVDAVNFEGRGESWSRREIGRYRRAETIAIMNYFAYFNIHPTPPPASVLILDDAHLAENSIREMFTVRIASREHPDLYKRVLTTFTTLRPNRYQGLEDIINGRFPPRDPVLIPFSDWFEAQSTIRDLLDEAADTLRLEGIADSIRFIWPRIRENADGLAAYITVREIEFRPVIFPSHDINHFAAPLHRIYTSATLGDIEDFQRRIGCSNIHIIKPTDARPGERGRRMIVFYPSSEEGAEFDEIRADGLGKLWPSARKRLWMCCSWDEVEQCKEWVPAMRNGSRPRIWELRGTDEAQLEDFRQARLGHLFTAARYDGMDFPGDQARLAIMPSPPVNLDAQEQFFSAFLRDASFMKSRFSQRVAQALGRCNRSGADFAVYVLLNPRFEKVFGGSDPDYLALLPGDIIPEVEAALEYAENGFVSSCEKAALFLSGEFEEWDTHVNSLRAATRTQSPPSIISTAQCEVNGWLAFWRGDPTSAAEQFAQWESALSAERKSGPLGFAHYCHAWARYMCYKRQNESGALQDAIQSLEGAARSGPSSWFTTTLRSALNDLLRMSTREALPPQPSVPAYTEAVLQAWDDILYEKGCRVFALNRWLDRCLQDLGSERHDEVVEGLVTLGQLMGFESYRPRGQGMTDVLWRFGRGPLYIVTWEIKAELANGGRPVALRDINQTHGQGRWAETTYGASGYSCMCFLAGKVAGFEPGASDSLGTVRCVSLDSLVRLAEVVRSLFDMFRSGWSITSNESRLQARQVIENRIPSATWLFEEYNLSEDFITTDRLTSAWIE
ncbi:helicase C-terminal domain-containing protein [Chloroflexota bacterium]